MGAGERSEALHELSTREYMSWQPFSPSSSSTAGWLDSLCCCCCCRGRCSLGSAGACDDDRGARRPCSEEAPNEAEARALLGAAVQSEEVDAPHEAQANDQHEDGDDDGGLPQEPQRHAVCIAAATEATANYERIAA